MIAASAIAIFLIPVTFYVIERLFAGREGSVSIKHDANDPSLSGALREEVRDQKSDIGN